MEDHTIQHIRTVLLGTLIVVAAIVLYVRLIQHFKKDMDKRKYAVLLPFTLIGDKLQFFIEVPERMEVQVEVLDDKEQQLSSLVSGMQEEGDQELILEELPESAQFIRLTSKGQQTTRRIRV